MLRYLIRGPYSPAASVLLLVFYNDCRKKNWYKQRPLLLLMMINIRHGQVPRNNDTFLTPVLPSCKTETSSEPGKGTVLLIVP